MTRIKVERQLSPDSWTSQDCDLCWSQHNNHYVKTGGTVYVFANLKEGTTVYGKDANNKWKGVGKVVHGGLFLGEGVTYAEYCETPEGKEKLQQFLSSLQRRQF